jgi:3-phenylpropionate/trans-cinnamate dioxygenase ferredoxin subunit
MSEFIRIASVDDIPVGSFKSFEVDFDRVLIVHAEDGFYALADECSHDAGAISEGSLLGHEVVCPRHGARFDVRTGAVAAPPAIVPIDAYETKIEGNDILVRLDR